MEVCDPKGWNLNKNPQQEEIIILSYSLILLAAVLAINTRLVRRSLLQIPSFAASLTTFL